MTYCIRLGYQDGKENIAGKLTIPTSVKKIGIKAFGYSSALSEIHYEGTSTEFNKIVVSELIEGEAVSAFTDSSVRKIICSDGTLSV